MITKYTYGNPFQTDAVVQKLEVQNGDVPYFTVAKTEEQLQFEYTLENEEKVYGLGENVRGINKRGWIYKSCCADEPNHLEDRTSLYASHNFLVLDGGKEQFGVFFDYPGIITFDVGYTHLNELKITLSEPDADVYIMTGESILDIVKQFRQLIGRSYIPPKWAFGYQQSRWGYMNEADIREVVKGHREKKIPLATSESVNIDVIETTLKGSRFMFNGVEIDLPLSGDHQLENAKTAQYAVISTIDVETGELSKGLKAVLGGSAKIYCTKDYMYINEYIEGERYGEPERDVTFAMKLNLKNGKFTYASETEVKQYSNNTIDIGRGDMYDSFLYPFGEYYISLGHDANDFKDEIILFDKNMKELDSIIFENECISVNTNLPRFDKNTNTITLPANYYDEGIEDYHYQGAVVLEITNNKIEINDRIKDSTHIINIDYENYYYCPQIVYDDCIYSIYINNNAPDNKKLKVFSYKF